MAMGLPSRTALPDRLFSMGTGGFLRYFSDRDWVAAMERDFLPSSKSIREMILKPSDSAAMLTINRRISSMNDSPATSLDTWARVSLCFESRAFSLRNVSNSCWGVSFFVISVLPEKFLKRVDVETRAFLLELDDAFLEGMERGDRGDDGQSVFQGRLTDLIT